MRVILYNRSSRWLEVPREVDLVARDGQRARVWLRTRPGAGGRVLARADGIGDRDAAAARVGWQIRVERAALPPLAPGEYYHGDVIGLPVVRRDGTLLGRVVEIHATGPVEVFVVRCEEGDRFVPSARGAIAEIGADRVVVEDGACASTF